MKPRLQRVLPFAISIGAISIEEQPELGDWAVTRTLELHEHQTR